MEFWELVRAAVGWRDAARRCGVPVQSAEVWFRQADPAVLWTVTYLGDALDGLMVAGCADVSRSVMVDVTELG